MKKYTYYLYPVLIVTLFVYAIGVIKSASLDPIMFGHKTRIVLAAVWGLITGYWLLWRRISKLD